MCDQFQEPKMNPYVVGKWIFLLLENVSNADNCFSFAQCDKVVVSPRFQGMNKAQDDQQ